MSNRSGGKVLPALDVWDDLQMTTHRKDYHDRFGCMRDRWLPASGRRSQDGRERGLKQLPGPRRWDQGAANEVTSPHPRVQCSLVQVHGVVQEMGTRTTRGSARRIRGFAYASVRFLSILTGDQPAR